MRGGWDIHIPLPLLTDDACRRAESSQHFGSQRNIFSISTDGRIVVQPDDLDASTSKSADADEYKMDLKLWTQAWPRLLQLIHEYRSQSDYDKWLTHYTKLANLEGRDDQFEAILHYDIRIRRMSCSLGLDPALTHQELMNEIKANIQERKVEERVKFLVQGELDRRFPSRDPYKPDYDRRSAYPPPPRRPQRSPDHRSRFRRSPSPPRHRSRSASPLPFNNHRRSSPPPYRPRSPPPDSFRNDHRPERDSFRNPPYHSTADSTPRERCIICGSSSPYHPYWKYCHATSTVYRTRTLLRKGPDNKFTRANGSRLCYNFNGTQGCADRRSCSKGEHRCSLCDSASHNAQTCHG